MVLQSYCKNKIGAVVFDSHGTVNSTLFCNIPG